MSIAERAPGAGQDEGSGLSVRVLVVVLAVQVVLAAVAVYFAVAGWPFVGGGRHATPVPARSQGAATPPVTGARAIAAVDAVPRPRTDRFDETRAFALLRRQVEVYGARPAGSAPLRRLAADLRSRLPHGRLEPVPGHPGLQNVVGVLPGRMPAIVVGAHYDTQPEPAGYLGANDGAAGTAAVVELARTLRKAPVRGGREVRFVLFDGEELPAGKTNFLRDALRGSKAYVNRHRGQVESMILLDYVAGRALRLPREDTSTPELWHRLRTAAARVGVSPVFPDAVQGGIWDDHTPFLDAGIPAIDLIDFSYPQEGTMLDDVAHVSARSLDAAGEAVASLLLAERRR